MKHLTNLGPDRLNGVTLIELLIVLAIGSILFSMAAPGLSGMVGNSAVTGAVNDMVSHLHLARSEAIKRRVKVTLCASRDNTTCLPTTELHHGFIIFTNSNGNGEIDDDDQLLRTYSPGNKRATINTTPGRKKISYKPNGSARGTNATISICDSAGEAAPRAVIISGTGRPRTSDKNSTGGQITCG